MSKIGEIVQVLCPTGVKYVQLGDVASYIRGITYSKRDENTEGEIRVLRANNIDLKTNSLIFNDVKRVNKSVKIREDQKLYAGDILISAASGSKAHVGKVAYINEDIDYCFGGFMAVLRTSKELDSRYLFHLLVGATFNRYLDNTLASTTINNLSASIMNAFRIPIPPLEVQKEIVSILDKFTQLEAELESELEARQKQYEYYRSQLLTFDSSRHDVKSLTLKELSEETFWIMPATPQFITDGEVPYITSKNIKGGHIDFTNIKRISRKSYESISKNRPIVEDDILISMIGTIGEVARVKTSDLDFYGQNMYLLRLNQKLINVSYFLHFFDSDKMKRYFAAVKNNSSQGYLKAGQVESIVVPIPPLEEQNIIVSVLDKFDRLNNSLSVGLPAEINARRQQYEYYRTKLLTFQELPA